MVSMKTVFIRNKEGYIINQWNLREDDPMLRHGIIEIPDPPNFQLVKDSAPDEPIRHTSKMYMRVVRTERDYRFVDFVEYP